MPPRRDGIGGDAGTIDTRLAGIGCKEAEEEIDGRRLARAIGPEQRENFAWLDGEVQFMDGNVAVEAFGEFDRFEHNSLEVHEAGWP